jgi:hypothetical protein
VRLGAAVEQREQSLLNFRRHRFRETDRSQTRRRPARSLASRTARRR